MIPTKVLAIESMDGGQSAPNIGSTSGRIRAADGFLMRLQGDYVYICAKGEPIPESEPLPPMQEIRVRPTSSPAIFPNFSARDGVEVPTELPIAGARLQVIEASGQQKIAYWEKGRFPGHNRMAAELPEDIVGVKVISGGSTWLIPRESLAYVKLQPGNRSGLHFLIPLERLRFIELQKETANE